MPLGIPLGQKARKAVIKFEALYQYNLTPASQQAFCLSQAG
jgi:hypothetical protein